jgi:alkylhydroperoxidase/carboxymuconolactone decarboxylase family protein YurZ
MAEDALWYEAAQVVGITNALNVVADALGAAAPDLLGPLDDAAAGDRAAALFAEIRDFYARAEVPLPFRVMAHDPAYAADVWGAVKRAFSDHRLPRRLKEALAFAVSLTTRSRFGTTFHLGEMRRLGVGPRGLMEVLGVTQMFSSYTKIADMLQLEPDMGDIAPVDPSPAPGGRAVTRIALPRRSRARAGTPDRPPPDRLSTGNTP